MQLILLKDIEKVGERFEIVTVKDGYGRNFLIPQGLAKIANKINLAQLEDIKRQEAETEAARLSEYQALATQLASQTIKIGAKAGTSGKIFGSVTNVQIAAAIKEQLDIDIERKKIHLPDDIKDLGTYEAEIILHKEVPAKVTFEVVAE
jgi:large subunit ribosomal protein L9